jgi:hypothetical protein
MYQLNLDPEHSDRKAGWTLTEQETVILDLDSIGLSTCKRFGPPRASRPRGPVWSDLCSELRTSAASMH